MTLVVPNWGLVTPHGMTAPKKEFKFSDQRDHAEEMMRLLGPLDDIHVHYGFVLVGMYIRTQIGTGVLEAAPQTQLEDRFQGKVGLVLKMGDLAFKSEPGRDFGNAQVQVGSWCLYRASDGLNLDLRTLDGMDVMHCKLLSDAEVLGTTVSPDRVW